MMVIYNNILPVKGFKCINLFGVLFVRKGLKMTDVDFNHEAIHTKQMKEMLYVFSIYGMLLNGLYDCLSVEMLTETYRLNVRHIQTNAI